MHNFLKKYFFIDNFDTKILDYQDKGTSIIYRNYKINKINLNSLILLRNYCKKKGFKLYVSNNFKIALKLKLNGAYIPSFNKSTTHLNFSIKRNFHIIGSAHNIYELRIKEKQRVNEIVISSLFKRNTNYLGLYGSKNLSNFTQKKIIVLGGITKEKLNLIKMINCNGFAGISYFKKKAPKKGP